MTTTPGEVLFGELEKAFEPLFERYSYAGSAGEAIADAVYELELLDKLKEHARALAETITDGPEDEFVTEVRSSPQLASLLETLEEAGESRAEWPIQNEPDSAV